MDMRTIIVAAALAVTACCMSTPANAQTRSCTLYFQIEANNSSSCRIDWGFNTLMGNPNLPATLVECNPGGVPLGDLGVLITPSCGAPAGESNDICTSCTSAGHPINLSTGNTYIVQSDISVPGLGGGLSLARTWNSILPSWQSSFAFMFGPGWRSTYEERLIINSGDGYIKYLRADGSVWSFAVSTVGTPNVYKAAAPANDTTTTITDGSPSWIVTFQSGEKRLFSATTGALTSILDRNGNTTQLTYDTSNRLTTVTDPASRHLYFNYGGPSSNLVSTVTTDVGLTVSYSYDVQGRLNLVTKPDNTTVSFVYDGQNRITAVKDSDGKILESHTYDVLGRGLTSSRANAVDSVTVTYP
jgi:YD repeat-containing protein